MTTKILGNTTEETRNNIMVAILSGKTITIHISELKDKVEQFINANIITPGIIIPDHEKVNSSAICKTEHDLTIIEEHATRNTRNTRKGNAFILPIHEKDIPFIKKIIKDNATFE